MSLKEAFEQGRQAYIAGMPFAYNPYDDTEGMGSHPEFLEWNKGYESAFEAKVVAVRELNDAFRTSFSGGQVVMTAAVAALDPEKIAAITAAVRGDQKFTEDNDPHGEHDFGEVIVGDHKIWWKIDCYDADMQYGSEDAADPAKTTRVLTILFPADY